MTVMMMMKIMTHKECTAFPVPIFRKLTKSEDDCQQFPCTGYHGNQIINEISLCL